MNCFFCFIPFKSIDLFYTVFKSIPVFFHLISFFFNVGPYSMVRLWKPTSGALGNGGGISNGKWNLRRLNIAASVSSVLSFWAQFSCSAVSSGNEKVRCHQFASFSPLLSIHLAIAFATRKRIVKNHSGVGRNRHKNSNTYRNWDTSFTSKTRYYFNLPLLFNYRPISLCCFFFT